MNIKKSIIIELLIGLLISIGIFTYFNTINFIPTGNDIFGHLYKTSILTENIKLGNWYPLYTTEWYNGIQLFRYWPILTYYVMAFIQLIVEDIYLTYYLFLSLTFLISYFGWCCIANREKRFMFVIIGVFYWFLPDNIRVTFGEGNLARLFVFALLPIFFYFFTNMMEYKKSVFPTIIIITLLTITHFMLAAMCAIIFTIYSFFVGLKNNTWYYGFSSFILGFLTSGLILFPGLKGGLVSDSSSASANTMKDWSQSLFTSISLTNRMETVCSFGLSVLIICILILIFSKKKTGTIISLVFFALTSPFFIPLLIQLPLSQVWWMARFIQMCYILIFYELGFIEFKKDKLKYLLFLLIFIDIIPSYKYFTRIEEPKIEEYLLDEAIEITDNRLGVVDESRMGPYLSYYVFEKDVQMIQGWAIQGASTLNNIVSITESMEMGFYSYSFKSLLELGCDSVLVKKEILYNLDEEKFLVSAKQFGYELTTSNEQMYLFDLKNVNDTFGVNFTYENLAIGKSAQYLAYLYPSFEIGESEYIEDYSFEELCKYKKIYLSNFEFDNQKDFETLLTKLSDEGIQIYIDTTHLPINYLNISVLLDIESRFVSIYDLNNLTYNNQSYDIDVPYEWYTTYLCNNNKNGISHNYKYGQQELTYLVDVDNIHFIGFNLTYLYIENKSVELKAMLDEIFLIEEKDYLVNYEIIPINIKYGIETIEINTEKEVNTTIAYQDNFISNKLLEEHNNLLIVGPGTTNINMCYKYFKEGMILSILGLVFSIIFSLKVKLIDKKLVEIDYD